MVVSPKTRYAKVGDADVAFQVVGEGPIDLVYFYGIGAHLELFWDAPVAPNFLRRLASFSRLILFNPRGTGASDRFSGGETPTWEDWAEDLLAVLDAAGSERAAIFATLDAGPIAILFAAMHPERLSALILLTTSARMLVADDYTIGLPPESVEGVVRTIEGSWGSPDLLRLSNPSMAQDEAFLQYGAKWWRASVTPRAAAAHFDYLLRSLDVRDTLPGVQAPTLVLHVRESVLFPLDHGRYLADHIDGARFVELPGGDTAITPSNYVVADEIAEFLTGQRPVADLNRILATVLFCDIVGSTAMAASVGDERWRMILDAHDQAVRRQLHMFRGREINTTGDGFIAAFDGPGRAVRCAEEIVRATSRLGVETRVGIHTGECEVRGADLSGLAVHIAARICALAGPGDVLVSSVVRDLVVGAGIAFEERGTQGLKGVPGEWPLLAVARKPE